MIIFEKGIPLPADARLGEGKHAKILKMEVGDSFYLEDYTAAQANGLVARARKTGMKFCIRKQEVGVRVWRKE